MPHWTAGHGTRIVHATLVTFAFAMLLLSGCDRSPPPATDTANESETLNELINALQTGDDKTRLTASIALGVLGKPAKRALPVLIDALKDRNRFVREQAAWSLVHVDPAGDEILAPLSGATHDEEPAVRLNVAKALGKIGPPAYPSVPELVRLLQDPAAAIRAEAAQALGSIGPAAEAARPSLTLTAEIDSDDSARAAATAALKRIDKK